LERAERERARRNNARPRAQAEAAERKQAAKAEGGQGGLKEPKPKLDAPRRHSNALMH
jgi:hypothetical protein